jgi:hypothetical protein
MASLLGEDAIGLPQQAQQHDDWWEDVKYDYHFATTSAEEEDGGADYDDLVAAVGANRAEGFRIQISQMTLTSNQQLVKICVMTVSSVLSILGSGTILFFCRKKFHRLYHRLLFALSLCDLIFSISYLFQPYAIPYYYQVPYGHASSTRMCRVVGSVFLTFSLAGGLVSCSLALYFYMTVVLGKTEAYLVRRLEKLWYGTAMIVPLTLTVAGLMKDGINPDSYAKVCIFDGTPGQNPPDVAGFRIGMAWFGCVFLSSMVGFRSTYLVYSKVRDLTKMMERYNFQQPSSSQSINHNPPTNNITNTNINGINNTTTTTNNNNNNSNKKNSGNRDDATTPEVDNNDSNENTRHPNETDLSSSHPILTTTKLQSIFAEGYRRSFRAFGSFQSSGDRSSASGERSFLSSRTRRGLLRGSSLSGWVGGRGSAAGSSGGGSSSVLGTVVSQRRVAAVSTQAILYSLAYLNSMLWPTLVTIVSAALSKSTGELYALDLMAWAFHPLQGFLNFFVYIRPTFLQWRKNYPEKSIGWALWQILEFENTFIPRLPPQQQQQQQHSRLGNPWGSKRGGLTSASKSFRRPIYQNQVMGDEDEPKNNNDGNDIISDDEDEESRTQDSGDNHRKYRRSNNSHGKYSLEVVDELHLEDSFDITDNNEEDLDEDVDRVTKPFQKQKRRISQDRSHLKDNCDEQAAVTVASVSAVIMDEESTAEVDNLNPTTEGVDNKSRLKTGPGSRRSWIEGRRRSSVTITRRDTRRSSMSIDQVRRMSEGVSSFFFLDAEPEVLQHLEHEVARNHSAAVSSSPPQPSIDTAPLSRGKNVRSTSQPIPDTINKSSSAGLRRGVVSLSSGTDGRSSREVGLGRRVDWLSRAWSPFWNANELEENGERPQHDEQPAVIDPNHNYDPPPTSEMPDGSMKDDDCSTGSHTEKLDNCVGNPQQVSEVILDHSRSDDSRFQEARDDNQDDQLDERSIVSS